MTDKSQRPSEGQFLVYQTEDGKLKIDVRFEGETVWLAQQQMAELFQTTKQNTSACTFKISTKNGSWNGRQLSRNP